MFVKVNLLTKKGDHVQSVLIPPFQTIPDAIMWGTRFFFPKAEDVASNDEVSFPDYYEGFAVAAVFVAPDQNEKQIENVSNIDQTNTEIDTEVPKNDTKLPESGTQPGNDDLLWGLPVNLEEAVETYLDHYRNAHDMRTIIDHTEDEFSAYAHHASGQFIRNSWFLWWHEGHPYSSWPASKPPIVGFFNELGIYHADDISGIIITSAYRKVNGKEIDLSGQVEHYKAFWKENGFPDGIYKPRK